MKTLMGFVVLVAIVVVIGSVGYRLGQDAITEHYRERVDRALAAVGDSVHVQLTVRMIAPVDSLVVPLTIRCNVDRAGPPYHGVTVP